MHLRCTHSLQTAKLSHLICHVCCSKAGDRPVGYVNYNVNGIMRIYGTPMREWFVALLTAQQGSRAA